MKALMTYSYRDENFAKYLTKEILDVAKYRFYKKNFRRIVYETLEEELKQILNKKIISCEIGIKICANTVLYLTVNIAYNKIKLSGLYALGGKNLKVGVVLSRGLFSNYNALANCFDDKFYIFSAKKIRETLEEEFPEFKFPAYDKYYEVYIGADYGISRKEDLDEIKETYMKNLLRFENVLYFMTPYMFVFVTKDKDTFFMAKNYEIEKLGFRPWIESVICSEEALVKFLKLATNLNEDFIKENLNNPELIIKLRKSAILANL